MGLVSSIYRRAGKSYSISNMDKLQGLGTTIVVNPMLLLERTIDPKPTVNPKTVQSSTQHSRKHRVRK